MIKFGSEVQSIVFNNYFAPNNVFEGMSLGGEDQRQFKIC
jgi:hypothetical protein